MASQDQKNDARDRIAANRRKRHVAALEDELNAVKTAAAGEPDEGKKKALEGRVDAIGAELKRVKAGGSSRSTQQQTRS